MGFNIVEMRESLLVSRKVLFTRAISIYSIFIFTPVSKFYNNFSKYISQTKMQASYSFSAQPSYSYGGSSSSCAAPEKLENSKRLEKSYTEESFNQFTEKTRVECARFKHEILNRFNNVSDTVYNTCNSTAAKLSGNFSISMSNNVKDTTNTIQCEPPPRDKHDSNPAQYFPNFGYIGLLPGGSPDRPSDRDLEQKLGAVCVTCSLFYICWQVPILTRHVSPRIRTKFDHFCHRNLVCSRQHLQYVRLWYTPLTAALSHQQPFHFLFNTFSFYFLSYKLLFDTRAFEKVVEKGSNPEKARIDKEIRDLMSELEREDKNGFTSRINRTLKEISERRLENERDFRIKLEEGVASGELGFFEKQKMKVEKRCTDFGNRMLTRYLLFQRSFSSLEILKKDFYKGILEILHRSTPAWEFIQFTLITGSAAIITHCFVHPRVGVLGISGTIMGLLTVLACVSPEDRVTLVFPVPGLSVSLAQISDLNCAVNVAGFVIALVGKRLVQNGFFLERGMHGMINFSKDLGLVAWESHLSGILLGYIYYWHACYSFGLYRFNHSFTELHSADYLESDWGRTVSDAHRGVDNVLEAIGM